MTDKKKPFSIISSPVEEEAAPQSVAEPLKVESESDAPDIKTPIERMIKKELGTDKFVLAYYNADGDVGFYLGEGIDPQEVSFATDIVKAQIMMQLLLE